MAKGKHSVALFEVIQQTKSSSRASSLRTPKWWFKSKKSNLPAPVPVEPLAADSTAPSPRVPGVDLKLDPDRKRLQFDVSYNSVIVAAFTVVVVVGLAYLIGSHMTRGPAAALAGASTDELLKGSAQPSVMKIGSDKPIIPPIETNPKTDRTDTIQTPPTPVAPPAPAAAQPAPQRRQRDAGLNYTVIQSFPKAEKAMAFEVADFLDRNGVACSVVTNLADYSGLLVVVGFEGFPRVGGADYRDYDKKIREVRDKFMKETTSKNAKFMRFDQPLPRRWSGNEKPVMPD